MEDNIPQEGIPQEKDTETRSTIDFSSLGRTGSFPRKTTGYSTHTYSSLPLSEEEALGSLKPLIDRRIEDLQYAAEDLALYAYKVARRAMLAKTALILLGAFVATRDVADHLIGSSNPINIVIYTFAGLLIATLAGLTTSFKWETRSVEITSMSATFQETRRKAELEKAIILTISDDQKRKVAVEKLLHILEIQAQEFREKAPLLGVNPLIHVRSVTRGGDRPSPNKHSYPYTSSLTRRRQPNRK